MIARALIDNQLVRIKDSLAYQDYLDENISKVDVGWHLDHSLKVINSIVDILANSDPKNYKKKFNMSRKVVFAAGRFPRGRSRAPKSVQPPETISEKDILRQIEEALSNLKSLNSLNKNANFDHRIFGILDLKNSIKFMEIHTNHHLAIIDDIVASKKNM